MPKNVRGEQWINNLRTLLDDVKNGHRLSEDEASGSFRIPNRDVWEIAAAADEMREQRAGNAVTYVRNQNINVTNLCVNACGFCGFSKKPGDDGIYFHDEAEIQKKAALAQDTRSYGDLHGQRTSS